MGCVLVIKLIGDAERLAARFGGMGCCQLTTSRRPVIQSSNPKRVSLQSNPRPGITLVVLVVPRPAEIEAREGAGEGRDESSSAEGGSRSAKMTSISGRRSGGTFIDN